jgi:hypothetical protein
VVLAVSPLAALSLRTTVKSCSTSVYTPYRALYGCFPFRSWWRFLLLSAMFWTIWVHFLLSQTDAGVHPARWAMAIYTPRTFYMIPSGSGCCCMVLSYSNIRDSVRFDQSFWNSGMRTLAMIRVTTTITTTVNCIREPHRGLDLHRPAARPRTSHSCWLHQTGVGREFTTSSLLQ